MDALIIKLGKIPVKKLVDALKYGPIVVGVSLSLAENLPAQVPVAVPEPGTTEALAPGFSYSAADQFLWDNNVFRLPEGYMVPAYLGRGESREDHINSASVGMDGNWTIDRQNIELLARLTHNTYTTFSLLDNNSVLAHAYWDWVAGGQLSGRVGVNEDRELINFSYARVFAKDMISTFGYVASGRFQLGPTWGLTASATKSSTNHSLAAFAASDGRSTSGSFGLEYSASPDATVELQYKYTNGGYPETTTVAVATSGGFHDNTTQILLHYAPSDATLLLGNAGYLQRSYATSGLQAYAGDIWHVSFKWDPGSHTEIQLAAGRDLKSYVDLVNEYFVDDESSIVASWKPRDYLALSLVLSWQNEDYVPHTTATADGFLRKDKLDDQRLTFTSSPKSWLTFDASIGLEQKKSNDRSFQFNDKIVSGSFKVSF